MGDLKNAFNRFILTGMYLSESYNKLNTFIANEAIFMMI